LLKSDRHDAAFHAAIWQSVQSNGVWQGELWNRHRNGDLYLAWLTITAVKGNDSAVTHYVGTLTDITQRRMAEDELNNHRLKAGGFELRTESPDTRRRHDASRVQP
jgi:hypothetical protein